MRRQLLNDSVSNLGSRKLGNRWEIYWQDGKQKLWIKDEEKARDEIKKSRRAIQCKKKKEKKGRVKQSKTGERWET